MKHGLNYRTLSVLFSDISIMIETADSMGDLLGILAEDEKDPELKRIIQDLYEKVEEGRSLSEAMEASGRFPEYAKIMVASGESAGKLEEVTAALAIYYDKRDKMSALAESALVQPLILLLLLAAVMGGFMFLILPMLSRVYTQLGSDGGAYVAVSYAVAGVAFALIAFVLVALAYAWLHFRKGDQGGAMRKVWQTSRVSRGTADLYEKASFFSDLTTRVSGGIMLDQAFEAAANAVTRDELKKKLLECSERINHGESMAPVLYEKEILPHICLHIIEGGVRGGSLEDSLQRVSEMLFDDAEKQTSNLIRKTEPLITGFFTIMVGISLLSMMLPLIAAIATI